MTPELYMYKNRDGGLVVLYSNDDAEACHVRNRGGPRGKLRGTSVVVGGSEEFI